MGNHVVEKTTPVLKEEIPSKGAEIVEESISRSERVAQELVFGINQFEDRLE